MSLEEEWSGRVRRFRRVAYALLLVACAAYVLDPLVPRSWELTLRVAAPLLFAGLAYGRVTIARMMARCREVFGPDWKP